MVNKDVYAEHEKQDWSIRGVIHRTLFRPFYMLSLEPVLILITIYLSLVYGLLYACMSFSISVLVTVTLISSAVFQAFPVIFIQRRGFTIGEDGLIFIGVGIGTTLGSYLNYVLSSHYPALIKKWRGFPPPEQRLLGGMIGGPGLVVGAFWLGWTGEYPSVPWYVPALSTILIGMSISMIFMSFLVRRGFTFLKCLLIVLTELSHRHVPDVQRVCFCGKYGRPLGGRCFIPFVYYPNVPKCKYSYEPSFITAYRGVSWALTGLRRFLVYLV